MLTKCLQKTKSEIIEEELSILWSRLESTGMEGIQIPIARMGVEGEDSMRWKARLHEKLSSCITKQPEHFILQERWLNSI